MKLVSVKREWHYTLERRLGRADTRRCASCSRQASDWALDWRAPAGVLIETPIGPLSDLAADYIPLCRACHVSFDRRRERSNVFYHLEHKLPREGR